MNFTCNGNIQSLIFGAMWTDGSNQSFPELQIWRRETESYIKVSSALIKVPRENASNRYWYNLTSPLAFGAGDILGYYQPDISTCQLALYFDRQAEEGHPAYFYASSHLNVRIVIHSVQLLLDVVTGKYINTLSFDYVFQCTLECRHEEIHSSHAHIHMIIQVAQHQLCQLPVVLQ